MTVLVIPQKLTMDRVQLPALRAKTRFQWVVSQLINKCFVSLMVILTDGTIVYLLFLSNFM